MIAANIPIANINIFCTVLKVKISIETTKWSTFLFWIFNLSLRICPINKLIDWLILWLASGIGSLLLIIRSWNITAPVQKFTVCDLMLTISAKYHEYEERVHQIEHFIVMWWASYACCRLGFCYCTQLSSCGGLRVLIPPLVTPSRVNHVSALYTL